MDAATFYQRVSRRTGLPEGTELRFLVGGTLAAIGEALSAAQAEALAQPLAAELRGPLVNAEHGRGAQPQEVLDRLALHPGLRPGVAVELLGAVAATLSEGVDEGTLHALREALPPRTADFFVASHEDGAAPAVHHDPRARTLAEASAASRRPLFAARPEAAHSESVARAENPHGESKLSSAQGLTQEREEETLATAHPVPDALSTAKP